MKNNSYSPTDNGDQGVTILPVLLFAIIFCSSFTSAAITQINLDLANPKVDLFLNSSEESTHYLDLRNKNSFDINVTVKEILQKKQKSTLTFAKNTTFTMQVGQYEKYYYTIKKLKPGNYVKMIQINASAKGKTYTNNQLITMHVEKKKVNYILPLIIFVVVIGIGVFIFFKIKKVFKNKKLSNTVDPAVKL